MARKKAHYPNNTILYRTITDFGCHLNHIQSGSQPWEWNAGISFPIFKPCYSKKGIIMKKTLCAIAALGTLMPLSALAVDATITKSVAPNIIVVSNLGTGLAQFSLLTSDFPSGTGLKTKYLNRIDWRSTSYPGHVGETVELCYFATYSSTSTCIPISINSAGSTTFFNGRPFGPGAKVMLRHTLYGGAQPAYPAGQDSVVISYSY